MESGKFALECWPETVAQAKQQQELLRNKVQLRRAINLKDIRHIAGTDVAFKNNGAITRAVVVVLSFPDLNIMEQAVAEEETRFPYIPGYLSYRELPALLVANKKLTISPDVYMCDGQGVAHPRRFGLASHLGVALGKPAMGVAKKRFVGGDVMPQAEKGAYEKLVDGNEQVGWVVRTRTHVKPVYVSPGHLLTMDMALALAIQSCSRFRLPEPTRIADKISKIKS